MEADGDVNARVCGSLLVTAPRRRPKTASTAAAVPQLPRRALALAPPGMMTAPLRLREVKGRKVIREVPLRRREETEG